MQETVSTNIHGSEKNNDFRKLSEFSPGLFVVLLPDLTIFEVSSAYTIATMTNREEIIGKYLFDVFPNNSHYPASDAVSNITSSFNSVLKTKTAHSTTIQRYDIRGKNNSFEEKHWIFWNKPVLNSNNEVDYIIHYILDMTEFFFLQKEQSNVSIYLKKQFVDTNEVLTKLNRELSFRNEEREKLTAELIIANQELTFQNQEKDKQIAELIIANKELTFVNEEKEKQAAEFIVSSEELIKLYGIINKNNEELESKVSERTAELELKNKYFSDYKFALNVSSMVSITNHEGIIQEVNEGFCRISKYSNNELIGKSHSIINSGYHSLDFIKELWETITRGNIWKGEMRNKAKDGTIFWLDTTIVPIVNEDGKTFKYLAIRSDITQRKQFIEDLKAKEENYRDLYENNLVALFTIDNASFKVIDVNNIGIKFFGYRSKKQFLERFHPSSHYVNDFDREKNRKKLVECGEVNNTIQEMQKLDGTRFWTNISIKLNSKNNTTQTVIIDVTQQVQSLLDLKVSEENYKDLFENSVVSIFTLDIETLKPIDSNDIAPTIFGYKTKDDFLNNFDISNHFVNFGLKDKYIRILIEKGELKNKLLEFKNLNGNRFWVNFFIKLNFEKKRAQIVIIDVTQQMYYHKELESKVKERTKKLTESLEREKELNEMKSRFVSNASHEFRTPLSSILSSASLIEMYTQTEQQENRVKHINRIYSSIKNLTDILTDYLSISTFEKNDIKLEKKNFNMPEFLESVIEEMGGMINQKEQKIILHHDGDVIINQSKKILRNILFNLLSNASKYSHDGQEIYLISSLVNNKVLISVQDFGIGIPRKDQKNLFIDFFRAKNVENIQGTGLGLSIVRKNINLLGGTIDFTSKLNEGTTFTIKF